MMTFRKTIFWIHLVSGLLAGIVIAIMSITGIAIAFEEEILNWIDRDLAHVSPPSLDAKPLSVAELQAAIEGRMPEFEAQSLLVYNAPDRAYEFFAGHHNGPIYINPYTAELQETKTHATHDVLHLLEEWHRWLAINPDDSYIGRFVTGVSNLAFLLLCLTGLYLWFPRKWSWRAIRPILWFKTKYKGKARDFNWHNVIGFWSLPVLLVLVATAVVISFGWAHKLVFTLTGEEAPIHRDFRMTLVPPVKAPPAPPGSERAPLDQVLANIQQAYPDYVYAGLNLREQNALPDGSIAPLNMSVTLPDYMPNRAYVPLDINPYTGEILRAIHLEDRNAGLQARIWIRFLHTGAAFGLPGKIVATLATAASLVLVYTGFALAYRRFFGKRRRDAGNRIKTATEREPQQV